jgi:hypothetical protein
MKGGRKVNRTSRRSGKRTSKFARITPTLPDRVIAALDQLAIDIRLRHRRAISRTAIIMAIVEAACRHRD